MSTMPIRVLHILRRMHYGGAETLIMRLYRKLDRDRIQFDFALHSPEAGAYDDEITALGGRIFRVAEPSARPVAFLKDLSKILAGQGPYQAVHSHTHHFSGVSVTWARVYGVPVRVAHSHLANSQLIWGGQKESIIRRSYKTVMKSMLRINATHFIGCSMDACHDLFGRHKRNAVFPNALETEAYQHAVPVDLRGQLGLPANAKIVMHIGRFSLQKNHRFLLQVFGEVRRVLPEAVLCLVGEGELRDEIEASIRSLRLEDSVHLLGTRRDIPELLAGSDVFVFPSLTEGLGNVMIEAQLGGVPCVTSTTVPQTADVGLGLVAYVDLQEPVEAWRSAVLRALETPGIPWDKRYARIKELGYDIRDAATTITGIYLS